MLRITKNLFVVLLSTAMLISTSSVGAAIVSHIEEDYIPGEIIVGLKDGIHMSQEELANPAIIFPGTQIVKIFDGTAGMFEFGYTGTQILLLTLTDVSEEYMLESISILEQNPIVKYAKVHSIIYIDNGEPDIPGKFMPGEIVVGLKDGVHLSQEELTNPVSVFPGIEIVSIKVHPDFPDFLPPYYGEKYLLLTLANDSEEYMLEAISILVQNPIVKSAELVAILPYHDGDSGIELGGEIRSYNPQNPTTIQLKQDGNVKYTTTVPVISGIGQISNDFNFENVDSGTYTLEITKPAHLKFTVNNIIVSDGNLDLTQDSRIAVQSMTLLCGDINGDGIIDAKDLNTVWSSLNYGKQVSEADNALCDLDGDGLIDEKDINIIWSSENYGKRSIVIE